MEKNERKIRGPRATAAQYAALLSFLETEKGLAEGKFAALHGKDMTRKKWLELAAEVNQIPGAVKSADQWQIVWRDMKSKASTKFKILKRERAKTGNQPLSKDFLTPFEERIVGIVGWEYMMGNEQCPDSFDIADTLNEVSNLENNAAHEVNSIDWNKENEVNCTDNVEILSTSNCGNGNKRSVENTEFAECPEKREIPNKRQKKEHSLREEFLKIAKNQADAMMVLANSQKETAKALSKIADSFSTLSEILSSHKRMEEALSKIEECVKLNNAVLDP